MDGGFLCTIVSFGSKVLFSWFSLEGQFPFSPGTPQGRETDSGQETCVACVALGPETNKTPGTAIQQEGVAEGHWSWAPQVPSVTSGAASRGRRRAWPRSKEPACTTLTPWNSSSMVLPHLIPPLLFT